jgi:WD40 repeat protein
VVRYSRQYGREPVRLNVNKFKCCRTLQGHTGKVCHLLSLHCVVGWVLLRVVRQCNSIQFSKLISISHLYNIVNKRNFQVLDAHAKFQIYALDWSYLESTRIVSASQDGRPIVWNAVSSQKTHAIRLACAWVMTAAFSPTGTAVGCGGLDNVCSIFHLSSLPDKDGNLPVSHTLMGHKGYLSC